MLIPKQSWHVSDTPGYAGQFTYALEELVHLKNTKLKSDALGYFHPQNKEWDHEILENQRQQQNTIKNWRMIREENSIKTYMKKKNIYWKY